MGWLFGPLFATIEAGPAAVFSWIIAGVAIIILALVHAELGGMFPLSGATARYPHFSHGSLVSFAAGWITWLGAVTIAPIEVLAVLTYASTYAPWLITQTVSGGTIGVLSAAGYVAAAVLMLVFTVINLLGVKAFAEANAALVCSRLRSRWSPPSRCLPLLLSTEATSPQPRASHPQASREF